MKHLARAKTCKEVQDGDELDELRKEKRKRSFTLYNDNNREKINKRQKDYDEAHKSGIRAKQSVRNAQNANANSARKADMLPNDRILAFKQEIIEGPNHVCLSCNKT